MQKRTTILIFICCLVPSFLQAQLTLSQSNFYVSATSDTVYSVPPSSVIAPDPTASFWDYSGLPTTNEIYMIDTIPDSNFPTAQVSTKVYYALGPLQINDFLHRVSTDSGYVELGNTMKSQTFSLEPFTANPADNLTFPPQHHVYNTPLMWVKYPVSPASTWTSESQRSSDFFLTITSSGLNNAPSQRRTKHKIAAEVSGWGQIVVPVSGGGASMPYDVLLVRERQTIIDSFYVNNAPAPTPLLNAFGLSQGQALDVYITKFYYEGNERPFMEIDHDTDSSYQAVSSCYFMKERVLPALSIGDFGGNRNLNIFPNPSENHSIFVKTPTYFKPKTCTILNSIGQRIFEYEVEALSSDFRLDIPKSLSKGIYFLHVQSDNRPDMLKGTFMLR